MSDYKGLFKHSRNYFFATLASKALAFVSIPVYTRLLTVEDYGVVNVFMSLVGIVSVMLTLSSEAAISRYYYDAKDIEDFKRFVGTSIKLTSGILVVTTCVFLLCLGFFSDIMSMPRKLILCLIPVALFHITNSIFTQIYNPLMQSKKIAIVSSVQSYTAFGLSVVCIMMLDSDRYYGYVLGNILAMVLLGTYMVKQIRPYFTNCFDKSYVPYILKYCLPYIPDTLSGIVLAQFSKIFIGNSQGFALAGSYGLVVNIATLMGIVIQITNQAWIPYYFRYMNAKDYKSIDNEFNLIWRLTLIAGITLSFFGKELAELLARRDFLEMMPVLPLLVSGYVFHQWAYLYLRNVGYAKRMMWNTYSYMFSGIMLVILNIILTPRYQGYGAAAATLLSYILLLVFTYIVNRRVIKLHATSLWIPLKPFIIYAIIITIGIWLYLSGINWLLLVIVKLVLLVGVTLILIKPYMGKIIPLVKNKYML